MVQVPKPESLRVAMSREELREVSRSLVAAFNQLGEEFQRNAKAHEESLEVAALFKLYRQDRHLDAEPGDAADARQKEIRAMMAAAIHGYGLNYLSDLATFGGWLADAAGKEWRAR